MEAYEIDSLDSPTLDKNFVVLRLKTAINFRFGVAPAPILFQSNLKFMQQRHLRMYSPFNRKSEGTYYRPYYPLWRFNSLTAWKKGFLFSMAHIREPKDQVTLTLNSTETVFICPDINGLPVFMDHHLVGLISFFDHEHCKKVTAQRCIEMCKEGNTYNMVNILNEEIQIYLARLLTDGYFSEFYY